jgi:hypothetical protein
VRPSVIENRVTKNSVRKEQNLARHPNLYLPTGRWNRVITNTRIRNFTLYVQTALTDSSVALQPIHDNETRATAEMTVF